MSVGRVAGRSLCAYSLAAAMKNRCAALHQELPGEVTLVERLSLPERAATQDRSGPALVPELRVLFFQSFGQNMNEPWL